MSNSVSFLAFSQTVKDTILIFSNKPKEKKNPFIIVNTDVDRGLYIKKFMKEVKKYKLIPDENFDIKNIETGDLLVFGNETKTDYTMMEFFKLTHLIGKDVKVFDLIKDYDSVVRRLELYCKNNDIKKIVQDRYENGGCCSKVTINIECPFVTEQKKEKKSASLVLAEKVTIHSNWVKIGYNQYDIREDVFGNELIILNNGKIAYIETDKYGRKYLTL